MGLVFSKAYLTLFAVKLIRQQLEKASVFDALANTEPARNVRAFTQAAAGVTGDAKKALPSIEPVKTKLPKKHH